MSRIQGQKLSPEKMVTLMLSLEAKWSIIQKCLVKIMKEMDDAFTNLRYK